MKKHALDTYACKEACKVFVGALEEAREFRRSYGGAVSFRHVAFDLVDADGTRYKVTIEPDTRGTKTATRERRHESATSRHPPGKKENDHV